MTVRSKLLISQSLNAILIIGIATVAVLVAQRFDYHLRRAELAYDQRQTITMLAVQTFRYKTLIDQSASESVTPKQIASARSDIAAALEQLTRQTEAEIAFVDAKEHDEEIREAARTGRLETELRSVDALVAQLMESQQAGRRADALDLLRVIDIRFEQEIAVSLANAMADEQREVAETDARVAELAEARVTFLIVMGVCALALSIATGFALDRSLSQPLRQLLAGVRALKAGNLHHRVPAAGKGEFAELGAQFNEMTVTLGDREQRLLDARTGLERDVQQRTAELATANERLKYLDRRRLLFLAEVSHELRTPVTVLRGEAEVTLRVDPRSPDSYRESLTRIAHQAEQMGRLIDDLMFLVRSEADTIAFDLQRIDLRTTVFDAAGDGAVLARGKNVEIRAQLPDKPLWVSGDASRLKQALMIAIDNAIKYCSNGAEVVVALACDDREAVVKVQNQGAGIPAEELPYVFERFYRIRGGHGRRPEGTGLGLPIAKWITEKHGGAIALVSTPGELTVLTIALPLLGEAS